MDQYQLIIKIPFESFDDPESRKDGQEILNKILTNGEIKNKSSVKLQRVYPDKPPRGVQIDY